ncbi:aldehyde dehydrogenase [Streptomyces sp. MNU77]|uniref:aldehyde dehydrogenase family protein n=1 Tax=Streptomyces sp. MNU77 TaxID=1573406 RepID=UPI0005DF4CD1|nr:aldehyde dehydrogenase family protein [Streptomyces sp. MNU77]OLO25817.1 aldehyde dehydrogenase [Streptomyces sp. MNU77]
MSITHDSLLHVLPEGSLRIGGERHKDSSGGSMERVDPSTGRPLASFVLAGAPEVDAAVAAARAAFPAWRATTADQRRRVLWRIARLIEEHEEEIKTIVALETGSPLSMNRLTMGIDYLDYYAGWADKLGGEVIESYPNRALDYTRYEPYGVIAALVTWNGPVINTLMKIAPALAAGNTVVVKPPENGPFAVLRLAELCSEAGLPDGVLNVIPGGPEAGDALVRHPDVDKVSFTGGPAVAAKVAAVAGEHLKPVVMELGGKSANIVFEDADLDTAAGMAAMMSVIASSGQGCLYPTRLLVQDSVYDQVVEKVLATAGTARPGDPMRPEVNMGPVIGAGACDRILGQVERARADGDGKLLTGGTRLDGDLADGYFVAPTVFGDVDNASALAQEEVFGPVLAILRFRDEEEAVRLANDTRYGLAAYVHTRDLRRAHVVAEAMDAGYVSVNSFPAMTATAPFGGTKASGFGREGGRAGIEEFVHHKNVYIPLG